MVRAMVLLFGSLMALPASAAELEPLVERNSGNWSAILYRNINSDNLFCAIESYDQGTVLRIVQYKGTNNTFIELVNQKWKLIPSRTKFSIFVSAELKSKKYNIGFDFPGEKSGNSYSSSFEDEDKYSYILGAIANVKSISAKNSNGVTFAAFAVEGANSAVRNYADCLNSDWMSEVKSKKEEGSPHQSTEFPLASCQGWSGTITALERINSNTSAMSGTITRDNIKEYCDRINDNGDGSDKTAAVNKCMSESILEVGGAKVSATANCSTGSMRFTNERGKITDVKFPLQPGSDQSCASGMPPLISQFAILCPRRAKALSATIR